MENSNQQLHLFKEKQTLVNHVGIDRGNKPSWMHVLVLFNPPSYGLNGFRKQLQECMPDLISIFFSWDQRWVISAMRYNNVRRWKKTVQNPWLWPQRAYPLSALQICDCGHEHQKIAILRKKIPAIEINLPSLCSSPWTGENDAYHAPKSRNCMLLSSGLSTWLTLASVNTSYISQSACRHG
jgi:hypothetical protein